MIHYYSKPGTRVGDIVDIIRNGKTYKAKVIKTGFYNYQCGTEGYANGDKYFEATIEYEMDIGHFHITQQESLLNNL